MMEVIKNLLCGLVVTFSNEILALMGVSVVLMSLYLTGSLVRTIMEPLQKEEPVVRTLNNTHVIGQDNVVVDMDYKTWFSKLTEAEKAELRKILEDKKSIFGIDMEKYNQGRPLPKTVITTEMIRNMIMRAKRGDFDNE